MSLYGTLRTSGWKPRVSDCESSFDGNLCRCTGYRPILDAAKCIAQDFEECAATGANAVAASSSPPQAWTEKGDVAIVTTTSHSKRSEHGMEDLLMRQEAIDTSSPTLVFPEVLKRRPPVPIMFSHPSCSWRWYAPTTLTSMLELAAWLPAFRIYNGNTDFLQEVRRGVELDAIVSALHVPELRGVQKTGSEVSIGLAEPLTDVVDALRLLCADGSGSEGRDSFDRESWAGAAEVAKVLSSFGSKQIRNWCGLGSLLLRSDVVPVLAAAGCRVIVQRLSDPTGEKAMVQLQTQKELQNKPVGSETRSHGKITADQARFCTQRLAGSKASAGPLGGPDLTVTERVVPLLGLEFGAGEVALRLLLPKTRPGSVIRSYRGRLRRDGAYSVASAAMRLDLEGPESPPIVTGAEFMLHDVGPGRRTMVFPSATAVLLGKPLPVPELTRHEALKKFVEEVEALEPTAATAHGFYRKALAASFFLDLLRGLNSDHSFGVPRPLSSGMQRYEDLRHGGMHACPDHRPLSDTAPRSPVGQPVIHTSAIEQSTGEAVYVDDLPVPSDCLWAAHVASPYPKAKIHGIDFSAAVRVPGVHGYFDYRDLITRVQEKHIPVNNAYKIFTTGLATAVGHTVGITVAETPELAKKAAALVKVDWEQLDPVLTVHDAVEKQSLIPYNHVIEQGDVDGILAQCREEGRIVEGTLELGGQEHFYLEPHAVMAVPGEGGEMTIYTATQCVHKTQKTVASALGVPCSKVVVKCKRMGGAFGGKEVLSTFIAGRLAIAAKRLRRSVRMVLDRKEDMEISGQRHPFFAKFCCGFDCDGRVLGYAVDCFTNGGHTTSITKDIMDRALGHAHNAYHIANFRAKGVCCDTNWYSFTAFRGFGAPQAMLVIETAMEMVAAKLGRSVEAVRLLNLMPPGGCTPYGQVVEHNILKPMWETLWRDADVDARLKAVDDFNRRSEPHRKRGLCVLPTKYGVNFPAKFLNQAGAFVCVYQQDATVLVCHAGTEMGQGLNIKLAQIAANALGCDLQKVHVGETSSDKVPNASPTAASVGSDLNGMAVLDACEQLAARLKPYRQQGEGPESWVCAVQAAYMDRVSLFAEGFYAMPNCGEYDWNLDTTDNSKRGKMYCYHSFGVCCAEVEVDLRTGEWSCQRADVLMDVGHSLNPAIDIGQIEGAFVQGMGLYTLEELHWAARDVPWAQPGTLVTTSPHTYKIPAASDVPCDFRVSLWAGTPNPRAVHSSKAVGEPPTFLSAAVFFAIKRAICAANGTAFESMDSPATAERIRAAFADDVVRELSRQLGEFRHQTLC